MSLNFDDVEMAGPSGSNPYNSDSEEQFSEEQRSQNEDEEPIRRVRKTKLSPHLKGLMGEANLRYARGEYELSKKMCFEVIRQSPDAYEPYLTLAQIYENGNTKKYRAFLILASHLQPSNASIWCRIAECDLMENNTDEAIKHYSKAISAEPANMSLHLKRLQLLDKKGDDKAILLCKLRMANQMPKKQHDAIIKICMEVAEEHFKNKNYIKSVEALRVPLKRTPDKVSKHLLNMILELLLLSERYSECLDIFTQFCGFTFDLTLDESSVFVVNSYTMPDNLQVDLKVKFIVCLIRLYSSQLVWGLISKMLQEDDVELFGDLYLDIIEALMATNCHEDALKLTIPMVKSKNYSLAGVWLKHAECLSACNMLDQAVEAYFTVMALAPRHVEVLYPLAMLLLKQDRRKEALEVLSQDLSTNKIDVAVLVEQMKLLRQIDDLENYWKACELLLSRHCVVLRNYDEMKSVMLRETIKEKITRINKFRAFRGQPTDDTECDFESINEPSIEDEYKLYRDILQFAFDKKEYKVFLKFAFMGLCSKRFLKYFDDILLAAYYACIYNRDYLHSFYTVRDILLRHPQHPLTWDWISLSFQPPEEIRHYRMLDRSDKLPDDKRLILANYHNSVGNYMESLAYFVKQYRNTKQSYYNLMMGIIMSQVYCQRQVDKSLKKMIAETVTYLFLHYAKHRSRHAQQEIYYNLGRMYQQLGVMYLAEYFYKKVFTVENELLEKYPEILCLKREAAYNLHVIYKNSGNFRAATDVLMKNIVI